MDIRFVKKIYFPHLLSILWTLIILYLSLGKMPDDDSVKINIPHLDKVVHFTMYFVYTALLLIEGKSQKKRAILVIALYSISFGILMEILQHIFFTYRSGDFFDFLFNTMGVVTSLLLRNRILNFIKP
jgi:VanZ family protein